MMKIVVQGQYFEIHPIAPNDLDAILAVYEQSVDFLELCELPPASLEMVLDDIKISKEAGGIFCGIYTDRGKMIGVIDYVPSNYCGAKDTAYLQLLVIAAPYRKQGIGKAAVEAVENEIRKNIEVTTIVSGVAVNNPVAIRFWQMNGYQIISEPKYYPGQGTGYDLRKDLAPLTGG